ncbi:MAG: YciI family protein, partial [Caulobacteraceae bacterium]
MKSWSTRRRARRRRPYAVLEGHKRIAFDDPGRTVIDVPFAETRELVAGFWIWEVKDMDEAVAWVKRCPKPMSGPSEIEIRPLFDMASFAESLTPEFKEIRAR